MANIAMTTMTTPIRAFRCCLSGSHSFANAVAAGGWLVHLCTLSIYIYVYKKTTTDSDTPFLGYFRF